MKKGIIVLTVFIMFSALLFLPVQASGLKYGLKMTGGLGYLSVGDPNELLEGRNILRRYHSQIWLGPMEGEYEKIGFGLDLEGDIIIFLTPQVGISLGSGYIRGKRDGDINKVRLAVPGGAITESIDTQISAVPVRLGIYYILSLSEKISFYINTGAGCYFGKFDVTGKYGIESTPAYWDNWAVKVKGRGLGFHGNLGFEYLILPHLSLVIEANGRYAKIKKFEGDLTESDSTGWAISRSGTLLYWEIGLPTGSWYPYLWIRDWISDPVYRNWRDAAVDFSGFSIKAGIKLSF